MFSFAEYLWPQPSPFWQRLQQIGVTKVVSSLNRGFKRDGTIMVSDEPWDYAPLLEAKRMYNDAGLELAAIEDAPPMDLIRLGHEGRDTQIEWFKTLLRSMGALEIPVLCYHWVAVHSWLRTTFATPGRGGALVTGYDHSALARAPLTAAGRVSEQQLWDAYEYFLEAVLPVAETEGVHLALHPDDPPLPEIRGVARIMRSVEAFERVLDLSPSRHHGITFCQGNFTLMTSDVPGAIQKLGRDGRIHFVHFRDVRGTATKFVETFHDEGMTDMPAAMQAYVDVGFDGIMRCDHVPTLAGETADVPGYAQLGRLFAIGYMTALRESAYRTAAERGDRP